jgi:hypothetical protein
MDFIPKSILNEVKKMKSTEKARALQVPNAPRSTTGSRLSPTKNKAIESQLSENMKMVLNTANRKNTDLENVVTPQAEERRSEIAKPTELQSVTNANTTNMQTSGFAGKLDQERQITPIENNIFKPQNEESKALTTRKEVATLRMTMNELIKSLGIDEKGKYPTEMELFVKVIQEENKIYNTVFKEIIRQVHVNMIERGEILAEIRDRYAKMFRRIPIQILELHTELVAHRKLNRRLSEELIRSKDNIAELLSQLDHVKEFDNELNSQAKEAQTKIITLLSTAQSAEESMEAFHKLYRMQRSRLENSLRLSEKEKRLWIDAATNLAIRIGHEYGIPDLLNLQKIEEARLRATNHMIVSIGDSDSNDLEKIEGHIDTWRNSLISLSNQIVSEDFQNIEVLCRIQKQMKAALRNLITNEPQNNIESGHNLLTEFHILDVQALMGHLHYWSSEMMEVTGRFTSNRDVKVKEEATVARRLTFEWMEIALRLLRRKQESTNGEDYVPLMEILKSLRSQITDWTSNLQNRAAGEGGIVNTVAFIQSQLEDRLTLLGFKGANTPLAQEDRNSNIQLLNSLVEQINNLISNIFLTRYTFHY